VTIEVDELDVVLARVEELGGRVVMDRATIPSVGDWPSSPTRPATWSV